MILNSLIKLQHINTPPTNKAGIFFPDCHHHYYYQLAQAHLDHCSDQLFEAEAVASVLQAAEGHSQFDHLVKPLAPYASLLAWDPCHILLAAENWKQHQIQFPKSHMDYQQIHYMQEGEQGLDEPQHCKDRQHQVFYQPEA